MSRFGRALLLLTACATCAGSTSRDAPTSRGALLVHVVNGFRTCTTAYLSAHFPPDGRGVQTVQQCPAVDQDANYVIPYPDGTTPGGGDVRFSGESGHLPAAYDAAQFEIADPRVDVNVTLQPCRSQTAEDAGVGIGACAPDAR